MKVGSLVVMIKPMRNKLPDKYPVILPTLKRIYTARDIKNFKSGPGIVLEEIVNKPIAFVEGLQEPYFPIDFFREVQPPKDTEEICKELLELNLQLIN